MKDETVKISIGTCQRAISIVERASQTINVGIPVMIRGEEVLITRGLRVQETHGVCGDYPAAACQPGRAHPRRRAPSL